jgi:hypothetical protein
MARILSLIRESIQDCKGEGALCKNKTECVTKGKHEVPGNYRKIGSGMYIVSEEELPWPQAQYECLNLHGNLAELTTSDQREEVVKILKVKAIKIIKIFVLIKIKSPTEK